MKLKMPPVTTINQGVGGGAPVPQSPSVDPWVPQGGSLGRRVSDSGQKPDPVRLEKANTIDVRPKKEKDSIMASSDLQEQLAELDRCIALLTTDMIVPDVPDTPPPVVHRQKSANNETEKSEERKNLAVPRPPARSRSSFESCKRLSQEFDVVIKRRSVDMGDGSDDVFTPSPQPQKLARSPFPPQTSVTRRQHAAPAPPPKRRMSLEERLSPALLQTLTLNPGAKPKEDIHSYKEDLDPEKEPQTPTFPTTPSTPYVNSTSPVRTKSPPGLMQTPLSFLHLKPTDSPSEVLHPHKDEKKGLPGNGETMQNGHMKETALLSDTGTKVEERLESRNSNNVQLRSDGLQQATPSEKFSQPARDNGTLGHPEPQIQPLKGHSLQPPVPPLNMNAPQQHSPLPSPNGANLPPQYQFHSGGSHSSHSPAPTSSNSRHGSSDSLDGPSTRHSNSSMLSSSSSASSPHSGVPFSPQNHLMRPGSEMSSYDRNHLSGTRSGDESLGSPHSVRTSSSSISDVERMNHEMSQTTVSKAPKFIRDTTAYWYKPDISRDQALALLRDKPAGCFVVRDSRCFPGAFGLALKVDKLPPTVQPKPGVDVSNEYVRHFLIEPSSRGVRLKGCQNEPVFGSLSALVYQHSITPLALPCKLIIPTSDLEVTSSSSSSRSSQHEVAANSAADLLKQGAACNVVYIGSVDSESLTGPQAVERAIRETYRAAHADPNRTSVVHFKVSPQGITLTDMARKLFFRRHYTTETVTYCGLDAMGNPSKGAKRRWDASPMKGSNEAWMFGFVARSAPGSSDNTCHVFAELDSAQPARAIVNFVTKVLIGSTRQKQP